METHVEALREVLAQWAGVPAQTVSVVRSPYRACPLGAHVDHQLGEVTGMALDRALLTAFAPRDDGVVFVRSLQFEGTVRFPLDNVPSDKRGEWGDYARGAAFALQKRWHLERGMTALVGGHEDVGGLGSSAAAGLAYLLALEAVNGLDLSLAENIELDRVIENEYIGLDNGILDQSMILLGRPGCLTHLDCLTGLSRPVPLGGSESVSVVVLFSGLRSPLYTTDYNLRVQECRQAAALLLREAGMAVPHPPYLRAVPSEVFGRHGHGLPEKLRRRAAHFFGEQERVQKGLKLWRQGDLEGFGRLISESGRSSVENYDCGNAYLRSAYEALRQTPGVYGARFSGAGFRGCCVGLVRPGCEEDVAGGALHRYLQAHPDMEGKAALYFCHSAPGAALLT